MRHAIAILYFVAFGFFFPAWVTKRARGIVALGAIAAPWIAFWCGWFAR